MISPKNGGITTVTPNKYFRKEPLLDFNEYTQPAHRDELEALAQTVQNIILIEKGTYPNDPDFGVGLGSYLFEFMDTQTISKLQSEIQAQLVRYVLNNTVDAEVQVQELQVPIANTNTLSVMVRLSASTTSRDSSRVMDEDEVLNLSYNFLGNTTSGKIVSRLNL